MPQSSQSYLDIAEIKQDTLVLKDGTLRAIILASSVNFALKSEEEQRALVSGYINMLNVLEYPLQILIQSRKMDIDDYVKELQEKTRTQTNELLKVQTQDYVNFIQELVTIGNIMTKKFYIVVPYSPFGEAMPGFFKRMLGVFSPTKVISLRERRFQKYKINMEKRVNNVLAGLSNMNLPTIRLDTEALIELFYSTYNPDIFSVQKLSELKNLQVEES